MIIAVDFDGTLKIGNDPNMRLIQRLKYEQSRGNTVILWTCREQKSLNEALLFLRKAGFMPNFVNQNAPGAIAKVGNPRKVFADIYIDDKSVPYI